MNIDPIWQNLAIGLAGAALISVVALLLKALSVSGAVGATLVGTITYGLGGWPLALPLLFFFTCSSILTAITNEKKSGLKGIVKKAGPRDFWQVMANGGPGTLCVLFGYFTSDSMWYYFYLVGLCEAAADTWATEVGTLSSRKVISVVSFKPVAPGISGGISLVGTMALFAGSIGTASVARFSGWNFQGTSLSISYPSLICALAGIAGGLIDSVLGATIQAHFRCKTCRRVVETATHCDHKTELIGGFKLINNDAVNVLSNITAILLAIGIFNLAELH